MCSINRPVHIINLKIRESYHYGEMRRIRRYLSLGQAEEVTCLCGISFHAVEEEIGQVSGRVTLTSLVKISEDSTGISTKSSLGIKCQKSEEAAQLMVWRDVTQG